MLLHLKINMKITYTDVVLYNFLMYNKIGIFLLCAHVLYACVWVRNYAHSEARGHSSYKSKQL